MRTIIKITTILTLGVILGSGCSGRKGGEYQPLDDADLVFPDGLYNSDGIPLDGQPFDISRQRLEGTAFTPVYFGYDSFVLPPQEATKLEAVARYLAENPGVVLIVEGHCDERGSNEYNLSLGEQRALTLRSYLVSLGTAADRIQSRSYGEERPAVLGTGEAAWRLNRRGEFAFYQ